jgi:hypothetical protein
MTEVLDRWQGCEYVPLPEVAEAVGLDQAARSYVIKHGIIPVAPKRGRNGRYMISHDTAVLLVAAGRLAAASGMAVATAIQVLRSTGAEVSGDRVVIPLETAA